MQVDLIFGSAAEGEIPGAIKGASATRQGEDRNNVTVLAAEIA